MIKEESVIKLSIIQFKIITSLIIIALFLLFWVIIELAEASAWPYQLNLTDGTIIDLNTSNVNETNFTIYIIHVYNNNTYNNTLIVNNTFQNYTYINSTIYQNITNSYYYNITNVTCINCSYYSNESGLNQSLADARYVFLSDYNSWKSGLNFVAKGDIDSVNSRIDNLNITADKSIGSNEKLALWIIACLGLLIGIIAIIVGWMAGG